MVITHARQRVVGFLVTRGDLGKLGFQQIALMRAARDDVVLLAYEIGVVREDVLAVGQLFAVGEDLLAEGLALFLARFELAALLDGIAQSDEAHLHVVKLGS